MTLLHATLKKGRAWLAMALLSAVAVCGLSCFGSFSHVSERDLQNVRDGEYVGRYKDGRWTYGVAVTIRDGKIRGISAPLVARGPAGTLSRQVLPRVIRAQSTDVDTVSGATRESEGLLRAIENAVP